jgi:hypothetical protein
MRTAHRLTLLTLIACLAPLAVGADDAAAPATRPAEQSWEPIEKELGIAGTLKDEVYTVAFTRGDLAVSDEEGPVPAALLKSEFQFYRCDCGKMRVAGQFCLAEYEANDVIDALRGGMMKVISVAPMFHGEHPRVVLVRFQGAAGSQHLAKTLKSALEWTGEARMAPATRPAIE